MKNNLKKGICFLLSAAVVCGAFTGFVGKINPERSETAVYAAESSTEIVMQIDNPVMTVNGSEVEIDSGNNTSPVIVNERTLVPIRAIIEAVDGSVSWDGETKQTVINYEDSEISLTIDSDVAYINGEESQLDSAPAIINGRTMLPIRFIAEGLGFTVDWNAENREITISVTVQTYEEAEADDRSDTEGIGTLAHQVTDDSAPVVYFTSDISSDGLMEIYNMLGFEPTGNVAIKLTTGEPPASNYLDPNLIKELVQSVDGTIVECNTAYGGSRGETAMHKQAAEDHGFTAIADVDIMDEDGSMEIPVSDKAVNLKYDVVGKNYANYDSMIVLSHFKGHAMGGFGGAIKNTSIGVSSSRGKNYIHSGGNSESAFDNDSYLEYYGGTNEGFGAMFQTVAGLCTQDQFLESMAEASQAVYNDKQNNGGIVYINVMNNLSIDCDCNGNPAEPEMNDVGILASTDPVALDQACVDIVYATDRSESGALISRIEERNGEHTLEHAAEIGFGSREYNLVDIDE